MLKISLFLFLTISSLFIVASILPVQAACGSWSQSFTNNYCNGSNQCASNSTNASGSCFSSGSSCQWVYTPAGSSCTATPGTQTCNCTTGGVCSGQGSGCGSLTQACSCSTGGSCSGSGSSCGGIYPGICSCGSSYSGTCVCQTTPGSCSTSPGGTTGGSCGGTVTCTWGAYGACSLPCGGGTQTRTDNCGHTETASCNTQACATPTPPPSGSAPPPPPPPGGTCNPSCPRACGDGDGCGGSCSNSDTTPPGNITNQSPADGGVILATNGVANLYWNTTTNASLYEIQIYPNGTPAGQECTAANTHCPTPFTNNFYAFTVDSGVTSYTWRVRGINTKCTTAIAGAWTTPISFTFGGSFSGSYYIDDINQARVNPATGLCELTGASLAGPGVVNNVTATWAGGQNQNGTINGAAYSIANVGYDPNTQVTTNPVSPYTCTCPVGCAYSGLSAPSSGINFFISQSQQAWWQTSNGNLFAGNSSGSSIFSKIPSTCVGPLCIPALSRRNANDTIGTDAYTISGGGSIDTTFDTTSDLTDLRQDGSTAHIASTTLKGAREDYQYWTTQYSMGASPTTDPLDGTKPTSAPLNGRAYYVNGDFTTNSAWAIAAGESKVIFVNGNLTVNQPITVAEGGFLAFIVKGNITFGDTVGQASTTSVTPVVEGVYIANQQIIVASNSTGDLKFVGAGMFIGWGGVQLNRQFTPTSDNNTAPTDLFIYRPDFIFTLPQRMSKPATLWQETNL